MVEYDSQPPISEDQSSKTLLLRLRKAFNVERIQWILPEQRASTGAVPNICLNFGNGPEWFLVGFP